MAMIAAAAAYAAFGLRIRSQVELPIPPDRASGPVDWEIVRADARPEPVGGLVSETRCDDPCHAGAVIGRVWRGPAGTWIWSRDSGLYHVSPDARRVTVYADEGADERAIALVLLGQVAIFQLHRLGYHSLHASAVLVGGQAVAFLGPPGAGKSTMASSFLRVGATLLTDDVLPLEQRADGVLGRPGAPVMKVWPATAAHTLGIRGELPDLTGSVTKKLLRLDGRYRFADAPARVRAVYLLGRYDPAAAGRHDVTIRRLPQGEAFPLLLGQSPRCEMLLPHEAARLLPLYARLMAQAPVRALRVPNGFAYQDEVREQILADLAPDSRADVRPLVLGRR
jgi:hypothetical protein